MCWVMPPASFETTLVCRIASRSLVLPWSTWPMTVTTGGRATRSSSPPSSSPKSMLERLEQLAVLLLGGHDLDVVVQLGPEQLQRLVVHRLGRGDHLAEVEQHLHQARRVGADLVREVAEAGAAAEPDDLALAARNLHAADRRRLHVVELLPALLLRLAATARLAAGTPERASGTAAAWAAATAAATGTRRTAGAAAGTAAAGTAAGTRAAEAATATGTRAAAASAGRATAAAATGTRAAEAATATGTRATATPGPPGPPGRGPPGPPAPPPVTGATACSSGWDAGRRDAGRPPDAGHRDARRLRLHRAGRRSRRDAGHGRRRDAGHGRHRDAGHGRRPGR